MIMRKWEARIWSRDAATFVAYLDATGSAHSLETEGNLGFQILLRGHNDGTSTVTTLSWWRDLDAVKEFAGENFERARYYPEDDKYLLDRPELVEHFEVARIYPRYPIGSSEQ